MNKTLWLLLISDIFLLTGFGLIAPILSIFIKDNLYGGTIVGAGLAGALYLGVKAAVQVPFAKYVDTLQKKKKWLVIGTFAIASIPFIYMFAESIWAIFLAQVLYGIGAGISAASWLSVWSTHLDKHQEGFEWSTYSAIIGLGTGIAAFLGAVLAENIGFRATFAIVGALAVIGSIILLYLQEEAAKPTSELTETKKLRRKNVHSLHYHKHRKLLHHKFH